MFVHMFGSRDREISSGEQNLDGEPSWMAGGLPIPTTAHAPQPRSLGVVRPEPGVIAASNWECLDPDCCGCPGLAGMWVNVFDHTQIRHTRHAPSAGRALSREIRRLAIGLTLRTPKTAQTLMVNGILPICADSAFRLD